MKTEPMSTSEEGISNGGEVVSNNFTRIKQEGRKRPMVIPNLVKREPGLNIKEEPGTEVTHSQLL